LTNIYTKTQVMRLVIGFIGWGNFSLNSTFLKKKVIFSFK